MLNLPKLIGHRGDKHLSPENTINSIELAKKIGLNWVEFDVKISKDQIPILFHDDSLERTTNGVGLPIDYNYKDLKKLDAGYFFYKQDTEIYIPTFQDILLLTEIKNININIQLKPNEGFELENVRAIAKTIKNSKFSNEYYFSSFDWKSLIAMKEIIPNANYGLLIDEFNNNVTLDDMLIISGKYNFFCCGLNNKIINSDIIEKVSQNNLILNTYSKNNIEVDEAKDLWTMGINSIFIDNPLKFKLV